VLTIPGVVRVTGPATGIEPILEKRWTVTASDQVLPALIEAGAYGVTLADAAGAVLAERAAATEDIGQLAAVVYDAVLCGIGDLAQRAVTRVPVRSPPSPRWDLSAGLSRSCSGSGDTTESSGRRTARRLPA